MTLKEIIEQAVSRTVAMGVPASQSRLAQQMGVARATISLWLLGRAFPTAAHIEQLAELAGVSREDAEEALWQAKRSEWRRRYRRPDVALSKPCARKGLARAYARVHARQRVAS